MGLDPLKVQRTNAALILAGYPESLFAANETETWRLSPFGRASPMRTGITAGAWLSGGENNELGETSFARPISGRRRL